MKCTITLLFILLGITSFSQTKKDPLQHARELKDSGQLEQAFDEVNRFIQKDSTVADYFDFRAEVYQSMKLYDDAIADYTKAISLSPKDPYFYHHRANLYQSLMEPDKAIQDNEMSIRFAPNDSTKYDFILNRGSYFEMKREFQKAYADFQSVLKFDSVNKAALTNMGAVLGELGRGEEAIKYLKDVVRLYPDFVGGYGNLAFQYQEMGQYKWLLNTIIK